MSKFGELWKQQNNTGCTTIVSLQNVDAGHYTEEEEEWGLLDDNHSCTKEKQNSFAEYPETNC